MWDRLKRWRKAPYVFLGAFTLFLLLVPMGTGNLYGSDGDWLSQHVAIAESLRQTMLSARSVLPQWVNLGGGSSIYDFAYYGVLRPDVLLSCLVPGIPMKYIISVYAMLGVMASGMLCYKWLEKQGKPRWTAVAGAVLLLGSTCFYQAHHQIMFVNYMPFLILALMGCDAFLEKKKIGVLCVSIFLMILHSFYYSPTGLCVIGIYGAWRIITMGKADMAANGKFNWRGAICNIVCLGAAMLLAVGMGMVLLLPTGLDILSTSKDAGNFAREVIGLVDFQLKGLLYSPYGCGMTLLTLFCLVLSLGSKKRRWLSACLLAVMAIPAVSLVLNGFLYARGKILIPFVPLLVMVCIDTLQELWERRWERGYGLEREKSEVGSKSPSTVYGKAEPGAKGWMLRRFAWIPCLLVCLIPAWESEWQPAILIEAVILAIWMIWWTRPGLALMARRDSSGAAEQDSVGTTERGWKNAGNLVDGRYKFWLILLFPIWVSVLVNLRDTALPELSEKMGISNRETYISMEDERQECIPQAQVAAFASDENYRMEYMANCFMNANVLCGGNVQRTSMYSSISNKTYAKFYYDTMGNAISYNNRVALVAGFNPVFNYFMGVRYLVCKAEDVPEGWQMKEEYGDYVLAENENVRPICYGSTEFMSREEFDDLEFPEKLAALSRYTVVESGSVAQVESDDVTRTEMPEELFEPADLQRFLSHRYAKETMELNFAEPFSGGLLVIRFHVNRKDGKEVKIYFNNMSNKLSAKSAPYPNGNEDFVYVLDLENGAESLKVKLSEGDYSIENLEIFTLARDILENETIILPEVVASGQGARTERFSLTRALWLPQDRTTVCQKQIDMPENGYFVTSYPFRKGYRVLVDGREVTPELINTAFVGVPLEAGKHEVEITFQAQGYEVGAIISVGCWGIFLIVVCLRNLRRRIPRAGHKDLRMVQR